jgi:hypothetical protein
MLVVTGRLKPVLILLVPLVRVSLTFLGGVARTSFHKYIFSLNHLLRLFPNFLGRCPNKSSPSYIHPVDCAFTPPPTYINMNFILPIRIVQVILAILVLATSAYGERISHSVAARVASLY